MNERGYEIVKAVFSDAECDALLGRLAAVSRSRAGARHLSAQLSDVANDPRLRRLARNATLFRITLFDKSRLANWSVAWHQDTALPLRTRFDAEGWGPWSLKGGIHYAHAPAAALERVIALRVHLDDSTPANGPLRVLPGKHRLGVLTDDEVANAARSTQAVDCIVARGGVLAMRPLLIHSSPRVTSPAPRRVLHIEYAESLEILPGIVLNLA
ncbi:MAG TPA: phytanoyl-CoA dioxygenase family protein [Thermoanaerobaculia bacterium]|nr:phytanoyl-CoA dioxygenase family protein [Thermoanaerobaculia bacterium]